MSELLAAVLTAVAVLAPVPADPKPDPLAWGYLGVQFVNPGSLQIGLVQPGTAAAKAGIQPGDDLVSVGSHKARGFEDVVDHISSFRPGAQLKVVVRRNGETKEFTVKLGVRPADARVPHEGRVPLPQPAP